jgi:cysteine desulfurase
VIYLDNNASTKLDSEVEAAMREAGAFYGNPSSVHGEGRRARRMIEEARDETARLIGASPEEIFFTSGGTEANAMAIFGATAGRHGRTVRSGAEHPSVAEAFDSLSGLGIQTAVVNPDSSGSLDPARVQEAVGPGTLLVSVMAANNEYGGLFPVPPLAAAVRRGGALFHTDAVQAAGRIPIDVKEWDVDLLSLSAHKFHGTKGAGALYARRGVVLQARTPGGGQEKKLRAGTENTAGIVGLGAAARLARGRLGEASGIAILRDRLEKRIRERVERVRVAGGARAWQTRRPFSSTVSPGGAARAARPRGRRRRSEAPAQAERSPFAGHPRSGTVSRRGGASSALALASPPSKRLTP